MAVQSAQPAGMTEEPPGEKTKLAQIAGHIGLEKLLVSASCFKEVIAMQEKPPREACPLGILHRANIAIGFAPLTDTAGNAPGEFAEVIADEFHGRRLI